MAGTPCASERTIKIATLVTDSTTERDVSETKNLIANDTSTEEFLTSFTSLTGSLIVRVAGPGSGYSFGTFCITKAEDGTSGTIIELNVLHGTDGEKVSMVWPAGSGPAIKHTFARTGTSVGAIDEEIVYSITLDTTA